MGEEDKKAELEQLQKDVEAFNAELIPLLAKYKLGLGGTPLVNGVAVPHSEFLSAQPQVFRDNGKKEATAPESDKTEESTLSEG